MAQALRLDLCSTAFLDPHDKDFRPSTAQCEEKLEMTDRPTFGPWRPGIDDAERRARCRSMRAVAGLIAGPRADPLVGFLLAAETDDNALELAADALDDLSPLDRRRILASYAARAAPPPAFVNPRASRLPRRHVTPAPTVRVRPSLGITPLHIVWHDPRPDHRRHRPGLRLAG